MGRAENHDMAIPEWATLNEIVGTLAGLERKLVAMRDEAIRLQVDGVWPWGDVRNELYKLEGLLTLLEIRLMEFREDLQILPK